MRLDELRSAITNSRPEDWAVVYVGPLYLDRVSPVFGADGHSVEVDSHSNLATYKADVDLRLAWGLLADDRLSYEGIVFPDPAINRVFVDAFSRGALVTRWTLLGVDGHRCYLPELSHAFVRTGESFLGVESFAWTVQEDETRLARLLQIIVQGGAEDFDRYLSQTGAVVVPDEPLP